MSRPVGFGVPLVPDPARYLSLVSAAFESRTLSNNGPLVDRLESELRRLLDVPTACATSSGTVALAIALRTAGIRPGGEVITTPMSFAASAHVLAWSGVRPVFADIDPESLTLDPTAVRRALTTKTTGILAVHLFGTVCDVPGLRALADEAGIPLLFDAAHAFGVTVAGQGVGRLGMSAFSLHATKVFHTGEGGVVTSPDPLEADRLALLRNFGLHGQEPVAVGTNAKLPETSAALGLAILDRLEDERAARRRLRATYDGLIDPMPGIWRSVDQPGVTRSESFYPVRLHAARTAVRALQLAGVGAKRYFPVLNGPRTAYADIPTIPAEDGPAYADAIAEELVCLPLHSGVDDAAVEQIARTLASLSE